VSDPSSTAVPVVLAGGSGTRLWPLSRADYPKQFLALSSGRTLLQDTVIRGRTVCGAAPVVVAAEAHRFLVAEQLAAIDMRDATIMLEPAARNTAAAIAVAAHRVATTTAADAVMLVMPADHRIEDRAAFDAAIVQAIAAAADGDIVLLGIEPTRAETGYGYITVDGSPSARGSSERGPHRIIRFVEKPDAAAARTLIAGGDCYWNSGMFVFRADTFLDALQRLEPDMHAATHQAVAGAQEDLDFLRLAAEPFEACRSVAVDVAVMERVQGARLVPFAGGWSDIGSWDAVHDTSAPDTHGNVALGDVVARGCANSYVRAESRLIVALGLQNTIVIETPDAVLVLDRDHAQDLKGALSVLAEQQRSELTTHRTCYRPWGHYESLIVGGRFQVKRISVRPGAMLSLQKHFHRAEHWVVVKGTAEVTRDDEVIVLTENESVYLPLGAVHRLHNPGRIALEIIEVQTGSYLGEDDIVRLGDRYGRG